MIIIIFSVCHNPNGYIINFTYRDMEQLFFDRIVKLLVTCPHFRGLNLLIDIVDGYEIYSAPNILGILPRDWERIKKETNLFTESGRIWATNWEKAVTSTTTNSKSTNKIAITGNTN